jgi:hypothetical protein
MAQQLQCACSKMSVIKYNRTTDHIVFWFAHHNNWSRWFDISCPLTHLFAVPASVLFFMGGGLKKTEVNN